MLIPVPTGMLSAYPPTGRVLRPQVRNGAASFSLGNVLDSESTFCSPGNSWKAVGLGEGESIGKAWSCAYRFVAWVSAPYFNM